VTAMKATANAARSAVLLGCLAVSAMAQIRVITRLERPAPEPVKPGTGSIEGVVNDSVTQEPVKKAQVSLGGPTGQPLTAVTDEGGRFAFRELPAGTYWLNAWKAGYRPAGSILGAEPNPGIAVGDGEQKQGVVLALLPGASISGRVTNGDGSGVRGCSVTAAQYGFVGADRGGSSWRGMEGSSTNEKGEYRMAGLAGGAYRLFVRCDTMLPAPHPLMAPDDPRTPHDTYLPRFYGGGLDPSGGTKLRLAAGATMDGIDIQVTRAPALAVRGAVTSSDPDALAGGVNLMLAPAGDQLRELLQLNSYADGQKRTFEFQSVVPGVYTLYAFATRGDRTFAAERSVTIGKTAPDPIEIPLTAGVDLKGSIQIASDDHRTPEEAAPPVIPEGVGQVTLVPIGRPMYGPQPTGRVGADGSFTLTSVLPGRWRLNLGSPNYIKSVSLGSQPVSPYGFNIGPGAAGPLAIVLGTAMGTVMVQVAGQPAGHMVTALVYPAEAEGMDAGLERVGAAMGGEVIQMGGLPPGRYRLLATDIQNPWPILQRPDVLHALENRTSLVEVPASGKVSVTLPAVPREDLLRAFEAQE